MFVDNSVRSTTHLEVELAKRGSDEGTAPAVAIALFAVYFVLATIAMFLLLTASAWKQKKKIDTTQSFGQIPCRNCQFFKENQYLKCAVHPTSVLTRQAINCQDYQPQNKLDA